MATSTFASLASSPPGRDCQVPTVQRTPSKISLTAFLTRAPTGGSQMTYCSVDDL